MKRRKFDTEFKRKVVARLLNGESRAAVSKDLGIVASVLYNWVKKFKKETKKRVAKKKPNKLANAIILLHHARDAAVKEVAENPDRFDDPVYGLAMMALRTLEGTSE
jgi:transposase-like protein